MKLFRNNKGFTLIELLVVIAIIALLLSILMPSLNRVKERAKQTICKTNLRGVGIAIKLYLNDYADKAFYGHGNRYDWFDAAGKKKKPKDAYWGMAYDSYTENSKIFSCSTFATMKNTIYTIDPGDILGGFGLNPFFSGNISGETEGIQVSSIRTPAKFIVVQGHVEPNPEDKDMFYIYTGAYNLEKYRTGSRSDHYAGIFRHNKRSRSLDEPAGDVTRRDNILENPNGQSNTLWLDGSVSGMDETTGEDVRKSWYEGE